MEKKHTDFLANPMKHESFTFMSVSEIKLIFNFPAFEYFKINHTIFFRKWERKMIIDELTLLSKGTA